MNDEKESVPAQHDHEPSNLKEALLKDLFGMLEDIKKEKQNPDPEMLVYYTKNEVEDILAIRLNMVNVCVSALESMKNEDDVIIVS